VPVLDRCRRLAGPESTAAAETPPTASPDEAATPAEPTQLTIFQDAVRRADEDLLALEKLGLPTFLRISNFVWPFLLLGLVAVVALGLSVNWIVGGVGGVVLAVALAIGSYLGLSTLARPKVARHYHSLRRSLDEAERQLVQTQGWLKAEYERRQKELDQNRENEVRGADERLSNRAAEIDARRQKETQEADLTYPARMAELRRVRDEAIGAAEEHYPPRLKALEQKYQEDAHQLEDAYASTKQATTQLYDQTWANLIRTWTEGLARFGSVAGEVNEESARRFLDWDHADLNRWVPPGEVPPGLPLGRFAIDLADFQGGIPVDPRLKEAGPTHVELPALVPFPIRSSVLIKPGEAGKAEAVRLLQALMLRFLTSVPPGKVRFTIFDPVGLGENFAAFMHLADYHELLVTSRIWTETQHIEQRLVDLQQHMENVIQKYLRNEFETIEDYRNTTPSRARSPSRSASWWWPISRPTSTSRPRGA
jgi:hypothetical protein